MKVLIQRVNRASVKVQNKMVGGISKGLLLLVGFGKEDDDSNLGKMAKKIINLRIFADNHDKMNLSIKDINGEILVIPQITLYAELKGQNRPYFGNAEEPKNAKELFNVFLKELKREIKKVATGEFGAYMQVELVNDGPVTILTDSSLI